jgi:hypothetical protein
VTDFLDRINRINRIIEVHFDLSDKMQRYRVFASRELWIKDPEGNILHIEKASDAH